MGNYNKTSWHARDSFGPGMPRYNHELVGDYVGIELELDLGSAGSYRSILDAIPNPPEGEAGPLTETDGSLSDSGGVEIIFPPIPVSTFSRRGSFFKNAINSLQREVGAHAERENCGMHINVNVADWDQNLKDLTLLLFHYLPPELIGKVGGRVPTAYSYYQQLGVSPPDWFRNEFDEDDEWDKYDDDDTEWCESCGEYH